MFDLSKSKIKIDAFFSVLVHAKYPNSHLKPHTYLLELINLLREKNNHPTEEKVCFANWEFNNCMTCWKKHSALKFVSASKKSLLQNVQHKTILQSFSITA